MERKGDRPDAAAPPPEEGPANEDRAKCAAFLKALERNKQLKPHGMAPGQVIGTLAAAFTSGHGPRQLH